MHIIIMSFWDNNSFFGARIFLSNSSKGQTSFTITYLSLRSLWRWWQENVVVFVFYWLDVLFPSIVSSSPFASNSFSKYQESQIQVLKASIFLILSSNYKLKKVR
jgi:hypothetical protein